MCHNNKATLCQEQAAKLTQQATGLRKAALVYLPGGLFPLLLAFLLCELLAQGSNEGVLACRHRLSLVVLVAAFVFVAAFSTARPAERLVTLNGISTSKFASKV